MSIKINVYEYYFYDIRHNILHSTILNVISYTQRPRPHNIKLDCIINSNDFKKFDICAFLMYLL